MELDNLKTIWREQQIPTGDDRQQAEMLASMLQERSRGPIERMRRNLRFESFFMIATYIPTIVAYFNMFHGQLWLIALMMLLILVFYLVYFFLKNRLLNKMQCVSCEVRSNLARQIVMLGKYIRFYRWSATLVTLSGLVVAFLVLIFSWEQVHHELPRTWLLQPAFLLPLLALFAVGSYFLNRWHIHKLYGRHIKKLKQLLLEMDEV